MNGTEAPVSVREADGFTLGGGMDVSLGTVRPADRVVLELSGVSTQPPALADEVFRMLEPAQMSYVAKDRAWGVVSSGATGGELIGGLRAAGLPEDLLAAVSEVA
ncbi:hypothetical protein [Actinomyces ruminis]|uniref:hypothetical protein n=1 Tax=Actinomyces ruminis TaxID=1937003 RepID=UPI0030B84E62